MIRDFVWADDHDFGWGWLPLFMGEDAGVVAFPAHDILEHRRGDGPSFAQECMALGRGIYVRGLTGGFGPYYRIGSQGEEIGTDMLPKERYAGRGIPDAPRHVDLRRLPSFVRNIITKSGEKAEESLWDTMEPDCDFQLDELAAVVHDATLSQREEQAIKDWMALGFMDARRRYAVAGDPYEMNLLWKQINSLFQNLDDGIEGQKVRVRVSLQRRTATLQRSEVDDYGRVVFPRYSRQD